jgi:hypothetical protein
MYSEPKIVRKDIDAVAFPSKIYEHERIDQEGLVGRQSIHILL